MPRGAWGPRDNPLLSGLFGVFQSGSAARQSTADVWSALRVAAGTWQWQSQGKGELPSQAELESSGAEILRSQGVGLQEVNTYRAIANQWRTARENLQALGQGDQIYNQAIFQPPWAQTQGDEQPSRYRVRVQWEITPAQGDSFNTWGTYEVDSPITSLQDILDQAGQMVAKKPTSNTPLGAVVSGINSYELEQI